MQIQSNQYTNNTNFGARIVGNQYLRREVRHIVKNGTLEQKSLLSNFLNLIKKDSNYDVFEMNTVFKGFSKNEPICEYIFTLDGGKKVYKNGPFVNESTSTHNEGDKHFVTELGHFIRKHYGEKVYTEALNNMPECLKKYLSVLEDTNNQLKANIKEALDLEPLSYFFSKDGKKIPATISGTFDKDYVC